jgi:asparagine synthase (glutamine-hydrolysing)
MCGIAGVLAEQEDLVREALPKMVRALAHRGPDDRGESYHRFGSRFLGLGHRRLSILDLSSAGHQPMVHPRSGSALTFNGEIYNFLHLRSRLQAEHEFKSRSDTEVLLQALETDGTACLEQLQGMFAFGWYDARLNRLVLARDPFGMKPLYVYERGGLLLFASELRSVLESGLVPRRIDRRGMVCFLAYGAVQQPITLIDAVSAVRPGHAEIWRADRTGHESIRYFQFPRPDPEWNESRAVESVRSVLSDAVRDHLISDVPVGVFLSSGLDSTVVAALAARYTPHMRSFTVGFTDQIDPSELEMAARSARVFGLAHTEVRINEPEARAQAVAWLDAIDQPSVDGLNVYVVAGAVRAQGIKVALSGQGGDELFGGYPSFEDLPRWELLGRWTGWLPAWSRRLLLWAALFRSSQSSRDKLADVQRSEGRLVDLYFHRRRLLSNRQMARLGFQADSLSLTPHFLPQEAMRDLPAHPDRVWMISWLESQFYQGNMLLPDSDAASMAHGVEVRLPMLDRRVLEVVSSIPGAIRLPNGKANKHLLRRAFQPSLRPELLAQRKRGFTLPLDSWMRGELRPLCEEALEALREARVADRSGIEEVWQGFLRDTQGPTWSRALALVVLGRYLKKTRLF